MKAMIAGLLPRRERRVGYFAVPAALLCLGASIAVAACEPSPQRARRPGAATNGSQARPRRADIVFKQGCRLPVPYLQRLRDGTFEGRSPDVVAVPQPPNYFGSFGITTHSGPWDYLQEVPLVLYGPGLLRPGRVNPAGPVTLADVAPTLGQIVGTP